MLPPLAVRAIFERTGDFFGFFLQFHTVERVCSPNGEHTELQRAVKGRCVEAGCCNLSE